jgi:hypothetical protein
MNQEQSSAPHVQHDISDEGTWWWEMNLPPDATLEEIDARFHELSRLRQGRFDDLGRLTCAYVMARDAALYSNTEGENTILAAGREGW